MPVAVTPLSELVILSMVVRRDAPAKTLVVVVLKVRLLPTTNGKSVGDPLKVLPLTSWTFTVPFR